MTLASKIEELGAAVDAGLLNRQAAIQHLTEYSDGGLTPLGAESALGQWQTIRARYADLRMSAELGMAAIQAARARGDQS